MLGLTDTRIARRPRYIVTPGWAGHRRGWGNTSSPAASAVLWYNSAGAREPYYSRHELAKTLLQVLLPSATGRAAAPARRRPRDRTLLRFSVRLRPLRPRGSGDLGVRAALHDEWIGFTVFREGPIIVNYFEFDNGTRHSGPSDASCAGAWAPSSTPPAGTGFHAGSDPAVDSEARARSERCARMRTGRSKTGLRSSAQHPENGGGAERRGEVASRLPVHRQSRRGHRRPVRRDAAQKEALRLAPDNAMYRRNLTTLLTYRTRRGENLASPLLTPGRLRGPTAGPARSVHGPPHFVIPAILSRNPLPRLSWMPA